MNHIVSWIRGTKLTSFRLSMNHTRSVTSADRRLRIQYPACERVPRQWTDAAEDARHPASVAIRLRNLFRLDNSACSIRSAGYRMARGLLVLIHPCMHPTFNPPSRCMTYLDKYEISRAIQRQRPSNGSSAQTIALCLETEPHAVMRRHNARMVSR